MRHSTRRGLTAGAFGLSAALILTACSGGGDTGSTDDDDAATGELTQVKLQLQWLPQAQFAGYFAAVDQGFFEEEGLEVEIIPSGGDIVPQDALANGDVDFAIAWVPKVLGSIEAGANLTDIAQIFQRSGTLQVSWADSGIESVADFEGKKIGSWGFGNEWEIFAAMAAEDLDSTTVEIITQDFNMNAFLQGDIDAAQAMTYNEYAQLLETTDPDTGELYQPEDFNVISYEDTVGAMLQDAIWADTERLGPTRSTRTPRWPSSRPSSRAGCSRRTIPKRPLRSPSPPAPARGPSHELWMMNEINKLIWPAPEGIGVIDEAAWTRTVEAALAAVKRPGPTSSPKGRRRPRTATSTSSRLSIVARTMHFFFFFCCCLVQLRIA